MADIDIDFGVFEGHSKFAIVCHNKFELVHCLKSIARSFPKVMPMTPNRYSKFVLDFGLPAAVSPNLHRRTPAIGYDHPSYYLHNGYIVVDFHDALYKDLPESDLSLEEFLGIRLVST